MNYSFNDDLSFKFKVSNGQMPERAWSNILTNDVYGYIATDAGTGHMWHLNSRENRMNRWLNDPQAIKGTERLEWRNGDKRVSLFAADDGYDCDVTYGFGYAIWEKIIDGNRFSVLAYVPLNTAARILTIETDCKEGEILYYTDLLLGNDDLTSPYIVTEYKNGIFKAQNTINTEFSGDIFKVTSSKEPTAYTCDRLSWKEGQMDKATGAGILPCFGMTFGMDRQIIIVAGCENDETMTELCRPEIMKDELLKTLEWWRKTVSPVTIQTNDTDLDKYINGWCLYQVIACRLMARCSIYQCGGAYGFRDQLQDVLAVIVSDPNKTREQIILAAGHQFEEGDVQHWWHPALDGNELDKGVRTRCSDDLLWLCYVLCEYVNKTGDIEICDVPVKYIRSKPLESHEMERYCYPEKSDLSEPVIDHCIKAAELVISRGTGSHGLCFVGNGDWNDGMNMVGTEGKGESVWLTWFAVIVFEGLGTLCRGLGNAGEGERLFSFAQKYRQAADNAWDGDWFLRGWYDNGKPLGSGKNLECSIDSIAQSFAVFANGDKVKTKTALESAYRELYDRENRIVRLFTPAFDTGDQSPGYIKGYIPGFRENGGQYTHGAIWLARAFMEFGMPEKGHELLNAILPATHDIKAYKAEPYVLAGDVSYNCENIGLAGWSWYTGAAGWFYRTALESLLGLHIRDGRLYIEPNLPGDWKGYTADWNNGDEVLKISVYGNIITVNGEEYDPRGYCLKIYNKFISVN